jgi:hypothetical protein
MFGYMKPYLETSALANVWKYEAVCRQNYEMWVTVGYMKLFVDRELNCG